MVFGPTKVALFVDGCFWHGCLEHGVRRHELNGWYWPEKIERNRRRDADSDARLNAEGWLSVRVWEHENLSEAASRIEAIVRSRR